MYSYMYAAVSSVLYVGIDKVEYITTLLYLDDAEVAILPGHRPTAVSTYEHVL